MATPAAAAAAADVGSAGGGTALCAGMSALGSCAQNAAQLTSAPAPCSAATFAGWGMGAAAVLAGAILKSITPGAAKSRGPTKVGRPGWPAGKSRVVRCEQPSSKMHALYANSDNQHGRRHDWRVAANEQRNWSMFVDKNFDLDGNGNQQGC